MMARSCSTEFPSLTAAEIKPLVLEALVKDIAKKEHLNDFE
jgi:hypothetical protein